MSYQVIARKWRPQIFEEVIGQNAITRTLRNAIEHDRLHHAYLFSGARGVGKTTTARLLAKALNCRKTDTPNPKPCDTSHEDTCVSCKEIAYSRSLDVLEFDAASHTKVDEIREIILESINVNPARDRFKVFIIDEVHMLSTSSFNALLKTLEEPPPNVVFVMATTELHKVPDTILSRCQQFVFRTIALKKILGRLKEIAEAEKISASDDALREIARSGEGSMRDAQSNFDQVISFSGETIETEDVINALGIASAENLSKTIMAIADKNSAGALEVVEDLVERGQDLRNFCRDLLTFVRDLLIVKIDGNSENLLESAILTNDELTQHSAPFLETDLVRFFNSIAETESKMRDANEPRYLLEIGLIKMIEMRKLTPVEELINRLAKLEDAISSADEISTTPKAEEAPSEAQEKKTLESKTVPVEEPFPVKTTELSLETAPKKSIPAKETIPAPKTSLPLEDESDFEPKTTHPIDLAPDQKISGSIKDRIKIDLDSMPVRLEPISAEDLEHIEDKKLDKEFENRLRQTGDDLRIFASRHDLLNVLFERNETLRTSNNSEAAHFSGGASAGTATAVENKALDIVSQMTEYEKIDETIPTLPENPSEDDLTRYAENHPLVKKVKRIFRGRLTKVYKQ